MACVDDDTFNSRVISDVEKKGFCFLYVFFNDRCKSPYFRFLIKKNASDKGFWSKSKRIGTQGLKKGQTTWTLCRRILNKILREYDFKSVGVNRCKKWSIYSEYDNLKFVVFAYKKKDCRLKEIKTVCEYLNATIKESVKHKKTFNLYYRGQLACWDLSPSLFRKKEWVENETQLNARIVCDRPDDFRNCNTTFDRLVKLKHYNQPSRLLDLSANPLIALFFACDSMRCSSRDDGFGMVVTVFSSTEDEKLAVTSDTVTMLSALANSKRFSDINSIKTICEKGKDRCKEVLPRRNEKSLCNGCSGKSKDSRYLGEIIHQAKKESGSEFNWEDLCFGEFNQCVLVKPPLNTNRISQQQGCFIMCGFNPEDFNEPPTSLREYFKPDNLKWTYYYIVPDSLDKIVEELNVLGINEYYIYPDLEKEIGLVKNRLITE